MSFINTPLHIIDIDLREESHVFVNELPISFMNKSNDSNKGLSIEQVLLKEDMDLKSIKLNTPLTFYNHPNITITPKEIIVRQISLVNFDTNEIKDLTSDKRLAFFQKFYEYYEKNGDIFKTTYSDFIKSLATTDANN